MPTIRISQKKSGLNVHVSHLVLTRLGKIKGLDLVMKDFYTRLFHNKIKSPAQRVKYEQVENNGLCRECPINVKDTIFHQLFECHDNKTLLMKLKEEYIAIDNLNLSLHAFN